MPYLLRESLPRNAEPRKRSHPIQDARFRRLLGEPLWHKLPQSVQARFSKHLGKGESCVYRGHVTHQYLSPLGKILAHVLRLIGAPLPFSKDAIGLPAVVAITEDAATHSQIWIRQYSRAKTFPQIVHSAKRFNGPTGLEEYIGFGIGMTLRLDVQDGALLFKSERYFIGNRRRVYLPHFLTPGALTVGHKDIGQGRFEFSLELTHKWAGNLVRQIIEFEDLKGHPK